MERLEAKIATFVGVFSVSFWHVFSLKSLTVFSDRKKWWELGTILLVNRINHINRFFQDKWTLKLIHPKLLISFCLWARYMVLYVALCSLGKRHKKKPIFAIFYIKRWLLYSNKMFKKEYITFYCKLITSRFILNTWSSY